MQRKNFILPTIKHYFHHLTFSAGEVTVRSGVPLTDVSTVAVAIVAGVALMRSHALTESTTLLAVFSPLLAVGLS